jgi:hypothetical protein
LKSRRGDRDIKRQSKKDFAQAWSQGWNNDASGFCRIQFDLELCDGIDRWPNESRIVSDESPFIAQQLVVNVRCHDETVAVHDFV